MNNSLRSGLLTDLTLDSAPKKIAIGDRWFGRRWINVVLAVYILLTVLFLSAKWLVLPQLLVDREQLTNWVSAQLGQTVQIDSLTAKIVGLNPTVWVRGLSIVDSQQSPQFEADTLQLTLSWGSLFSLTPEFTNLEIIAPKLWVEKNAQGWWVMGRQLGRGEGDSADLGALDVLFAQDRAVLREGQLHVTIRPDGESSTNAPKRYQINDLELYFEREGMVRRLGLRAAAGDFLAKPLAVSAELDIPPWATSAQSWRQWSGRFYADMALRQPDLWNVLPQSARLTTWADLDEGRFGVILAQLGLNDWHFESSERDASTVDIERASVTLQLQDFDPATGEVQAQFRSLLATVSEPAREPTQVGPLNGRLGLAHEDKQALWTLAFEDLNAQEALGFAKRLASSSWSPAQWESSLQAYEASGLIKDFGLSVRSEIGQLPEVGQSAFAFNVLFQRLSVLHISPLTGQQAGFSNLTGLARGNNEAGQWWLNSLDSRLNLQELFGEQVIALNHLRGQGVWQRLEQDEEEGGRGLELTVERLALKNDDLDATLKGRYAFIQEASDEMDLRGVIARADVAKVPDYLPGGLIPAARNWLDKNLRAGVASGATFVARGPVQAFPYHEGKGGGEFYIRIPVEQASLSFAPDWPTVEQINGLVELRSKSLNIQASDARTEQVLLSQVQARIENLDAYEPVLTVTGQGAGKLADMVDYVNKSPVSGFSSGALSQAQVSGQAELRLDLTIPLVDTRKTQVKGQLELSGNKIRLVPGMPWVSNVSGSVAFDNTGIQLDSIKGRAFGRPLVVSGGTRQGTLRIQANGQATAQGLADYLDPVWANYLSGQTDFSVEVVAQAGLPRVEINSNLQGMEVKLPSPFTKPANDTLRFGLTREQAGNEQLWTATLSAPNLPSASARAALDRNGVLQFLNASYARPMPEESSGVHVDLSVDKLNVDAWRTVGEQVFEAGALTGLPQSSNGAYLPIDLTLNATELAVAGNQLSSIALAAKRIEDRWQFDIQSQGIEGYFSWDATAAQPDGVVLGRFTKFTLPETLDKQVADMVDEPVRSIPALDIEAEEFFLGDLNLGRLVLRAENPTQAEQARAQLESRPQQWTLNRLELITPESTLQASGTWTYNNDLTEQRTEVDLVQTVSNAGDLLDRLGQRGVFRGGTGDLSGTLSWADAPSRLDESTLSGQFELRSKDGQFLKADPGVAKLLGVLSLQGMTRRLSLDFQDLFDKGFAYDELTASVQLQNGVATTPNFKMIGPSATVVMDGQLDLGNETQNLNVLVLPDLNATGGSIIYSVVAANPAVGLASLIADYLFKDPLSKVFSLQYKVTGPWANPEIQRVRRASPASGAENTP